MKAYFNKGVQIMAEPRLTVADKFARAPDEQLQLRLTWGRAEFAAALRERASQVVKPAGGM